MAASGGREVAREQAVLDRLYARLDELRASTAERLAAVLRSRPGGNPQNRSERDALAATYDGRLVRLSSVEARLTFGRLDLRGGERRYVGRIGLSDDEQRQLLVDWRAPAAEPFYRATAAEPGDVLLRRHIATRGRQVTGLEDEALDLDALAARTGRAAHDGDGRADGAADSPASDGRADEPASDGTADEPASDGAAVDGLVLNGEGALMAALGGPRTGRMGDIVATIQAEQDRIIRSPLPGVLVVEGGPGTGKTAVALHRAAYLLYTYRERVRSGVLVVGPSPVFLRYIEAVLPSLGETGVVMATPGRLFPGVDATAAEDPRAAALKGDLRMASAVRRAVRARERVPDAPRTLFVDGTRIELVPEEVARARSTARRSPRPHNRARTTFVRELLLDLGARLAEARGRTFDPDDAEVVLADLRDAPDVRREVNLCWMPVTPQRLLADLWADEAALADAAPWLTPADRALLRRPRDAPWTAADVPLLDEAAELLGEDDAAERAERRRLSAERAAEVEYAQQVLASTSSGVGGMRVSAEALADRFSAERRVLSVAERAATDRSWTYAHVVVDEAQELSPMAWRLLVRRCPTRSMTVVGDPAQTASLAGPGSWAAVLDRAAPDRWRVEELTVSYRTPAGVMALAAALLAAAGLEVVPPRAVRSGAAPAAVRLPGLGGPDGDAALAALVRAELAALGEGRLAVVVPRQGFGGLVRALAASFPPGTVVTGAQALDAPVAVLDVGSVKGLEFDVVVLVEPAAVLAASPRGVNDLYVGLTRPTRRLVVVHEQALPAGMEQLAPLQVVAGDPR